ncbi:MAG: asparaginase [Clostridia bacterium]|nr:asparaginase [Clostridia bacterium]
MKKILIISTGGTICSRLIDGCRRLAPHVSEATVITNFYKNEKYVSLSGDIFENSGFSVRTLSENMTFSVLERLISHLKSFDLSRFAGVVILHGTDTLAYTASLLAMMFSNTPVPIMLVSGDAPPDMEESNANVNFYTAVDLIFEGIAPNVYVPYRNADGEVRLHLGSVIMQSPSFSSDFHSGKYFDDLVAVSEGRKPLPFEVKRLDPSVLMLHPFVNLDYSRIDLDGVTAVAHGSYHSGTFCTEGDKYSILTLAENCRRHDVPLFVAPCKLGDRQYESVYSALSKSDLIPVSMTLETLYMKLTLALSAGLHGEAIRDFVMTEYNSEII